MTSTRDDERARAERFEARWRDVLSGRTDDAPAAAPSGPDAADLQDLVSLAQTLAAPPPPPDELAARLARQLPAAARRERRVLTRVQAIARRVSGARVRGSEEDRIRGAELLPRTLAPSLLKPSGGHAGWPARLSVGLAAALVVLLFLRPPGTPHLAMAAEILDRADRALIAMVGANELFHRQWEVVTQRRTPDGTQHTSEWIADEWVRGANLDAVAGQRRLRNGQRISAYARDVRTSDQRARIYFAPGFRQTTHGLLSIEPTRAAFEAAAASFPPAERDLLDTYLRRGYMYEPIAGERRFNRRLLEPEADSPRLPRLSLSVEERTDPNGVAVYAVRLVEPVYVTFRWTASGPPSVYIGRKETVRYIAQETFLTLRSRETVTYDDGTHVVTTYELKETRAARLDELATDPFAFDVPEGTPVRYQSAQEYFDAVVRALAQRPAHVRDAAAGT